MARVTVGTENGENIEIHYEDHGSGQPVDSLSVRRSVV